MNGKTEEEQSRENFTFLISNEVRFAVVSAMSLLKQPLNLTKLSKLTGYSTTTLIHHIPSLLERELIINSDGSTSKRKYYSLGEKYFEISFFNDNEAEVEENLDPLIHAGEKDIKEYKLTLIKFFGDMIQSNQLDESLANGILTLAMFNKTQASITAEFMKNFIMDFKQGKVNLDIPITFPTNSRTSFNFSSIRQLNEFQSIYFKFLKDLSLFRKRIKEENKGLDENQLEKAYFYMFVSPIINIDE